MGAGGDVTCAAVFSSQLQEVVLDLGVSDPAAGRAVAACGNMGHYHTSVASHGLSPQHSWGCTNLTMAGALWGCSMGSMNPARRGLKLLP